LSISIDPRTNTNLKKEGDGYKALNACPVLILNLVFCTPAENPYPYGEVSYA